MRRALPGEQGRDARRSAGRGSGPPRAPAGPSCPRQGPVPRHSLPPAGQRRNRSPGDSRDQPGERRRTAGMERAAGTGRAGPAGPGAVQSGHSGAPHAWTGRTGPQPGVSGRRPQLCSGARGEPLSSRSRRLTVSCFPPPTAGARGSAPPRSPGVPRWPWAGAQSSAEQAGGLGNRSTGLRARRKGCRAPAPAPTAGQPQDRPRCLGGPRWPQGSGPGPGGAAAAGARR